MDIYIMWNSQKTDRWSSDVLWQVDYVTPVAAIFIAKSFFDRLGTSLLRSVNSILWRVGTCRYLQN